MKRKIISQKNGLVTAVVIETYDKKFEKYILIRNRNDKERNQKLGK